MIRSTLIQLPATMKSLMISSQLVKEEDYPSIAGWLLLELRENKKYNNRSSCT